jgi:hypothetical protein
MCRKQFFFGKKNQKTFISSVRALPQRAPEIAKVFWFFFPKKNCLPMALSYG